MSVALPTINQAAKPAGVAGESRDDLALGVPVVVSDSGPGPTRAWLLLDKPDGSAAVLTTASGASTQFTPDIEGTYRVQLIVNGGPSADYIAYVGAGVQMSLPSWVSGVSRFVRIPAWGEKLDFNVKGGPGSGVNTRGWAYDVNQFLRTIVTYAFGFFVEKDGASVGTESFHTINFVKGDVVDAGGGVAEYDPLVPTGTEGDILVADAAGEFTSLSIGTPGQMLAVESGGTGLEYVAPPTVPTGTEGDILIADAVGDFGSLAIGTASQQLRVNAGETSLEYFTPSAAVTSVAVAKTVFVDGTNGSAAGTRGDAADPFQTIAQGLAAMQTGDTLLVRPGTYSEAVTIPNLADVRIVLEPGAVITTSGAVTITRSSSTALTSLLIEGGTIGNTHATGTCLLVNGASVGTPGYGDVVLRDVRLSTLAGALTQFPVVMTCIKTLYVHDVQAVGTFDLNDIGLATLRNLDGARSAALDVNFNAAGTPPNGYSTGTLHVYSGKFGSMSLAGSLTATTDASCELGDVTTARSAGTLTMVDGMTGDLTVSDTGTASSTFTGTLVDGDVTDTAGATYTDTNITGTVDVIGVEASFNGGSVAGAVVASGGGGITIDGTILAVPATGTGGEILDKRETNGWIALVAGTDYTATPASTLTLTMGVDYVGTIRPGMAVRWVSSVGVLTNNTWVA